jgi:hypothetical protein
MFDTGHSDQTLKLAAELDKALERRGEAIPRDDVAVPVRRLMDGIQAEQPSWSLGAIIIHALTAIEVVKVSDSDEDPDYLGVRALLRQ